MNTYILSIVIAYFFTRFLSDKFYLTAKKYNMLTYPDKDNVFPTPVLYNYSYIIISVCTVIVFFATILMSNKFKELFIQDIFYFTSIFAVIIISSFIFVLIKNKNISILIVSLFNTFLIYYNQISLKPELFGKYDIIFVWLWFLFFLIVFNRERSHVGTSYLMNSIIMITLSIISFYLSLPIHTNIYLIIGISLLCIFRFSYSPPRILPGGNYSLWFASVLGYISIISHIKLTTLALILIIPLSELVDFRKGRKEIDFSMLKKGFPERKIHKIILIIQIIFGLLAFIAVHLKNEILSFSIFITLFLVLFLFNNINLRENERNKK